MDQRNPIYDHFIARINWINGVPAVAFGCLRLCFVAFTSASTYACVSAGFAAEPTGSGIDGFNGTIAPILEPNRPFLASLPIK